MNEKKPKVSVIITSYNKQKYLNDSINSVLNQDYKQFELIIVDDASNDNSKEIIKKFSKKDKRIKTLFRNTNSGTASIPRNEGAKIAKYEYLCFLDADDKWKPDKLSSQINQLNKNTIFNFTACEYVDSKNLPHSNFFINYMRTKFQKYFLSKGLVGLFSYNPIILSSVMIEKKIFKKYYFDISTSTVGVEDLDLWLKILYDYPSKFSFNEKKLTIIRKLSDSLNRNYTQASLRNTYCVIKFFLEKKDYSKINFFLIGLFLRSFKSLYISSSTIIKKKTISIFSIIFILYIFVLKTPAFWYVGKYLTYWDEPVNTDAIVILSGNGDVDYINTGYQRRYLDVKKLIINNNFKFIYLMGRKQEIEEYEILSALFVADGVDQSKIKIVSKTFRNTKENIRSLVEILKKDQINSINFVTAPYHTKRSKLLWDRYKDGIHVNILENVDKQKEKKWKTVSYNQIKIIFYEFSAIVYNKLRGYF